MSETSGAGLLEGPPTAATPPVDGEPRGGRSGGLRAAGLAAATCLLDDGVEAGAHLADPFRQAFADRLIDGLSAGMANPKGWMRNVLEGSGRFARSLTVEPEHGFVELIQNADDVGAHTVRFALTTNRREVYVVHDGGRIAAPHVLAMTLALVSTKPDDSEAIGKFGIGLKTVSRLASSFEAHCNPYHFRVTDQRLERVAKRPSVAHLYRADKPETLIGLVLKTSYPPEGLETWFRQLTPDALLFMRSVRRLELRSGDGRLLDAHELQRSRSRKVVLDLESGRTDAQEVELRDDKRGEKWWRLTTRIPVPDGLQRTDKATPKAAPFAVAYCSSPGTGRLFAGLPLSVGGSLPFHLNALFDTDASRTDLLQEEWNGWILDRLMSLCAAGAPLRLVQDTKTGWQAVPLQEEVQGVHNEWLRNRLQELVSAVQDRTRTASVQFADGTALLADTEPEVAELEVLLSDEDVRSLTSAPTIEWDRRDEAGRWRDVLSELGSTTWVGVADALEMLDWEDLERSGSWFVQFIDLAVTSGLGSDIEQRSCLLLGNGTRISPLSARKNGLMLGTSDSTPTRLSDRLRLNQPLDGAFFADDEAAGRVRTWLTETVGLRTQNRDDDALEALSGRDPEAPLYIDDTSLRLLRDALRRTSGGRARELAHAIGRRVLVDGREYKQAWASIRVRPADAYLPSAIDTGKDTWAKAAAETKGLLWIHPRYARILGPSRTRGQRLRDAPEEARRRRAEAASERTGVQSFFHDLGAETAPRLEARASDDWRRYEGATRVRYRQLTDEQRNVLGHKPEMTGLQRDHLCPDLDAVLANMAASKVNDRRPRARALIRALSRAWPRLYAQSEEATAVEAYGSMIPKGTVPATWIARAAEVRWMTNERGHKKAPRQLAIRTVAFEAIFGDAPALYAYGLDTKDLDAHAVRGFRFMREPRASNLLDRVDELRARELKGAVIDGDSVTRCYRALSQSAPPPEARGRRLDDVTISEVKERFRRRHGDASGLIRTSDGWKSPAEVLLGRPIFKGRRSFVADDAPALWRLLDMHHPTPADCARVLSELAEGGEPRPADDAVLIETYRYLVRLAAPLEHRINGLRRVPVWTGRKWTSERPVYAVSDPVLQLSLGERVAVWRPPLRLREVLPVLDTFNLTPLEEETFRALGINSGALAAGSRVQDRFRKAAAHLREWLAVNDAALHEDLAKLPGLETARVAINAKLHVEIPFPNGGAETVPRQAHVQRTADRLLFVFASATYVEDSEIMGRLLGQLLDSDERAQLVLAHGWLKALERVDADAELAGLELPSAAPESPAPAPTPSKSAVETKAPATPGKQEAGDAPVGPPPRKLQKLSDIEVKPTWGQPLAGATEKPARGPGPDGAEDSPLHPPKSPASTNATSPSAGPVSWTSEERETLGLQLLIREMKRLYGLKLEDVRKQKNVGADAVDQHGRYYELKAHAGDMPDTVRLEPSEFKRADEQKEGFVLAVVAGLEEGYESNVRLVADPLKRLKWEPNVEIVLSGLTATTWAPTAAADIEADAA